MLALNGIFGLMAALGGLMYIVVVVSSVFFGKKVEGKIQLGAPEGPPAVATYGSSDSLRIPGTLMLVAVFFVAFVLYYFVNWKYLSDVWPMR
jgi:cytochrome c oxidase subunit 1